MCIRDSIRGASLYTGGDRRIRIELLLKVNRESGNNVFSKLILLSDFVVHVCANVCFCVFVNRRFANVILV